MGQATVGQVKMGQATVKRIDQQAPAKVIPTTRGYTGFLLKNDKPQITQAQDAQAVMTGAPSHKLHEAVSPTSSSKSKDSEVDLMWSKMFPESQLDRPTIIPMELLKQFPALSSNPLLYKSYFLYKKRKEEFGTRYLCLDAFTDYFTHQDEISFPVYEQASEPSAFVQPSE
jgi:hypothetical protein